MLGPRDLVLCAGTVPRASFREKVEAAADAGFAGVSLFVADYESARAGGSSDAELRGALADRGVAVADLDPLLAWIPGAGPGGGVTAEGMAFFRHGPDDFFRVADALGARSLNVALASDPGLPRAALAEHFADLCDRAAEHGLLVHLEFLPWSPVPDLRAALEVAELAGRPNGGVTLDAWHLARSGGAADDVRTAAGARILAVQLSDAPSVPEPDLVEETLHRRLLPGQGAIDLAGVVRAVAAIGAPAPLGVEVFSDALAALPAAEAARRAGDAARAVIAAAGAR
jgi:sugar phosphate isomerase/epimerase